MRNDHECLFVLKFPFATNGFHMISRISGFDTTLTHINSMYQDQFGKRYPYVMLQRYHKNLKEKKLSYVMEKLCMWQALNLPKERFMLVMKN